MGKPVYAIIAYGSIQEFLPQDSYLVGMYRTLDSAKNKFYSIQQKCSKEWGYYNLAPTKISVEMAPFKTAAYEIGKLNATGETADGKVYVVLETEKQNIVDSVQNGMFGKREVTAVHATNSNVIIKGVYGTMAEAIEAFKQLKGARKAYKGTPIREILADITSPYRYSFITEVTDYNNLEFEYEYKLEISERVLQ